MASRGNWPIMCSPIPTPKTFLSKDGNIQKGICSNWREMLRCLGDDLDDAHHPFVFMVDSVTVVNETPDDHRISKRDEHLQ